ncbi:MAG: hypothetical protein H6Q25_534 [Bacteroidetes bacterium]|nr:hypothetical protein [Bacteroidota bacterium]
MNILHLLIHQHSKYNTMKIGFDAKRAFNNSTGLGNYSRAIINIMSKYFSDNEYILYTSKQSNAYENYFKDFQNIQITTPNKIGRMFPNLWRSLSLTNFALKDKLDIYHGLSHELPVNIHHSSIKSIVTMHDLIVWRHPEYFKYIDRITYQKKQLYACKIADIVIAISEQTKQDLIEILNIEQEKIKVVYQPCSSIFTQTLTSAQKLDVASKYNLPNRYILFVGTMEERKNLLTIIRSMPLIDKEIHLVAVGRTTDYFSIINEETNVLKLTNRIHFIHNADFYDFPAIYANAEVFVYPSFFEGFGIPVLEALHCGVPVITSNTSSLPEVGGNAALYINPTDHEALAQHINNIIGDKILSESMIQKGKVQALCFSEEKIAQNLWNVYKETK